MSAITVEHLHKAYGRLAALRDASFEVAAGQVVAVLGADPRRAGRAWQARVGLVLQSTSLDLQLTVREALDVQAGLFPRPWPAGAAVPGRADDRPGPGGAAPGLDGGRAPDRRRHHRGADHPLPGGGPAAGRPRAGPVLAGHVRYQLLLLLRSPRALWAGVLLPVMLLVLTNLQQHQVAAASMAGAAGLGAPVPLGAAAAPGTPPSQALTARWTRAPAPPHRSRTAAAGGDW
jgi:hypothetical protein